MRALNEQFVDEIVDRVKMTDIFNQYDFKVDKKGFVKCPFHVEKTASLKAYNQDTKFHCFGCGKTGSVIDFVMELSNLSLKQAIVRINYDFGLNLPMDEHLTLREKQKIIKANKDRKEKLKLKEEEKRKNEHKLNLLFNEWKRLDDNLHKYKPKEIGEELNPLFVEALQKITHQEYILDLFDLRGFSIE